MSIVKHMRAEKKNIRKRDMTIGKHMRRKKPLREREPSLYRQAYAAKQKQRETWVSSFLSVWR